VHNSLDVIERDEERHLHSVRIMVLPNAPEPIGIAGGSEEIKLQHATSPTVDDDLLVLPSQPPTARFWEKYKSKLQSTSEVGTLEWSERIDKTNSNLQHDDDSDNSNNNTASATWQDDDEMQQSTASNNQRPLFYSPEIRRPANQVYVSRTTDAISGGRRNTSSRSVAWNSMLSPASNVSSVQHRTSLSSNISISFGLDSPTSRTG
jgi:hypothetical protein